jgi:TRAP-type C4-dicarboxylate transport system substrate-binding protein
MQRRPIDRRRIFQQEEVMKKMSKLVALALFSASALTTARPAAASSFNATIAAGHPPVFRWVKMMPEAFIPSVNKALEGTDHSITFSEQYGGAIAGLGEELEAAEAGLAEIAVCSSLFDPAKLAVQNVTYYTPFVSADPLAVNTVMTELQSHPAMAQAWADNNVVYLGGNVGIDDYLLMTNFPVESLADLEGHKIAAPGPAVNWLSGTGAVAVSGNLTTYYNELKAKVYDGVIVFASAALPGKLYEVAPNVLKVGLGAQFAGALCANKDWYDGLPAEVQTALKDGAAAAQAWYIDNLQNFVTTGFKGMADAGATITDASDDMRNAWASGMDNAAAKWAAELDGQGKSGSEILSAYMDAMRAAGATPVRDWDKE